MEKESTGERGMGVGYKGSQGQTKRTVELQEEEEAPFIVVSRWIKVDVVIRCWNQWTVVDNGPSSYITDTIPSRLEPLPKLYACRCRWSKTAFLKLWSADHKWSSGSAIVVLLD
jgi:hypothetical protein